MEQQLKNESADHVVEEFRDRFDRFKKIREEKENRGVRPRG